MRPRIAPAHRTVAAVGIAPLLPMVATPAQAAVCPVIAPAHRTAAGIAPLLPMAATPVEAAACADIAPLLPREGALAVVVAVPAAVVVAVPAAAEAPTAGAASSPWRRLQYTK